MIAGILPYLMRLSFCLLLLAAPATAQNYRSELLDAARLGDYHRVNYAASVVAVDTRDSEGRTALLLASMEGHARIVALLLEKGANPNVADAEGKSALRHALHEHPEVAKALLEGGADANERDGDGNRLLMNAVIGGDAATVRLLLDGGADPSIRNNEGLSPLTIAEEVGASEVVDLLRAAGAQKSIEEQLDVAIRGGDVAKATSLLERDIDVDRLDTSDYQTPLMTALEHDNLEIVKLLLARDADPTVEGTGFRTTGQNALTLAAARANVEALAQFSEARLPRKEWNDAMLANCASVEGRPHQLGRRRGRQRERKSRPYGAHVCRRSRSERGRVVAFCWRAPTPTPSPRMAGRRSIAPSFTVTPTWSRLSKALARRASSCGASTSALRDFLAVCRRRARSSLRSAPTRGRPTQYRSPSSRTS